MTRSVKTTSFDSSLPIRRTARSGAQTFVLGWLVASFAIASGCGSNQEPIPPTPNLPGRDLNAAGIQALLEGDLDVAAGYFADALEASRALDDRESQAEILYNWALVDRAHGNSVAAATKLTEAESLFRELDHRAGIVRVLVTQATEAGIDAARAAGLIDSALEFAPEEVRSEVLTARSGLELARGNTDRALRTAELASESATNNLALSDALFRLAEVHEARGDLALASASGAAALELDREAGRRRAIARSLRLLERIEAARGNDDASKRYGERAAGVEASLDSSEQSPEPE